MKRTITIQADDSVCSVCDEPSPVWGMFSYAKPYGWTVTCLKCTEDVWHHAIVEVLRRIHAGILSQT